MGAGFCGGSVAELRFDDYYVRHGLSEEELAIRQMVREFVDEQVIPIIAGHYEAGTFPLQLIPKMAELGILGTTLEGYDCAGANNVAYGLAAAAIPAFLLWYTSREDIRDYVAFWRGVRVEA